ncbi:hypothetical protein GH714_026831 [Hevea brasiliensis]|uniref:Uncharacterized protein n=1 Tax=Hevea brasiliensis TaxID=3981 RepID=A0A6A6MPY5_HEVBR|nr:hypothetical protein GH714_026831 [Hevea brasiliensis]
MWVLSSKEVNFPYPLGLTLLHMVFSSILCFALTKVFKVMKVEDGMTLEMCNVCQDSLAGKHCLLYKSVAFAQMLKAIMPVAVFILGVAAGIEVMSCRMMLIMSVISFGVLVASYGEINISWIGVVYQMGGVVAEALRLIFMEIRVKKERSEVKSYICNWPVPLYSLDHSREAEKGNTCMDFQPLVLTLNSLCTFALNLSVFLVVSHTSALTICVAGVVKGLGCCLALCSSICRYKAHNHKPVWLLHW